jgi:hypothetical protein
VEVKDDGWAVPDGAGSFEHHQNHDSGPLAGENVMNVILVSAECSPWCKTGICVITLQSPLFFIRFFCSIITHIRTSIVLHRWSWRCCWCFAQGFGKERTSRYGTIRFHI